MAASSSESPAAPSSRTTSSLTTRPPPASPSLAQVLLPAPSEPTSTQPRRLTTNPAIDTEPVWSTDGTEIYFTSDRSGGPQVYRVPADATGKPRRVTFEGSYNARPRLAADGRTLAVVHNDRGNYRIAVVDLKRKTTQVLSDGRQDESPSFAPNDSMIIYATRRGGRGIGFRLKFGRKSWIIMKLSITWLPLSLTFPGFGLVLS